MHGRRVLILTVALALVCSAGGSVLAQRNNNDKGKQPQRPPQEQQDVQALVTLVDTALMADTGVPVPAPGAPAPAAPVTPKPLAFGGADKNEGDVSVKWLSNHFVKGQSGDTYVPFTLGVDKAQLSKGAALYVRIVSAEQAASFASAMAAMATPPKDGKAAPPPRPSFQWDSVHFLDAPDGQLSRAVQLKPGQYVAFIAVKEKSPAPAGNQRNNNRNNDKNAPPAAAAAGPVGLLRHEITVPDYNTPDLRTSSVIVAQSVEPLSAALPADQQEANPYVFGPMRIVPSADGKFSKSGELSVIFWIYGAKEAASGKPDVVVDYSFHQKLAEGEKYFNKTAPQPLNAETLPPQFSIAAGHQLPGSLVIPLASFPAGDYRLEIKVTDKPSGATLTQNVNFTVLPV